MLKEDDIRNRQTFNKYIELLREDIEDMFSDHSVFVDILCPACASNSSLFEFEKEGFRYVSCCNCATLFVSPRPTLESLIAFYSDSVSAKYWVEEFFKPVAEIRSEKIFKPRAKDVNEILKNSSDALLGDIGAGFGLFLEELAKINSDCQLVAIEPSREQSEICQGKGFTTICSALEEVVGYDNKFDFLTAYELFEHLFDPQLFLQHVFRLLKPGAFFLMSTLNGQGFDIQLLWDKSKSISPPSHLNFFNPDSINNLFNRCGFEIQEITTPGKLDWDIVEGMVKYEGIELQRFFHMLAEKASERCKEDLQEWIAKYKLSSHMVVLAKKEEY